ncbi:retropepsin-like aspartic protease family protein [Thalassobius sp. S69A]|uniref:retropepsin-like aspartic protease family protein n=1 Tax=unclassified Thalassovita TaxID=2619711 RepID=UPI000C0D857C|nr:TIGR02281 family clan AA aspartic protease [Paracoccaceae bacterium]MBT26583.1 TIGR02281 family clan AA aspartic protease [Paracoccaceae bacterium]
MTSWEFGRIIYLVLLLVVVGGWFFIQNRNGLSKLLQQALIWVFLFIGVIAAIGLWEDVRNISSPRQAIHSNGQIEIPASPDGHFYLTAQINGTPVRFVVDTGATDIVLSRQDALKSGLDPEELTFLGEAMTANGVVRTAPVRLQSVSVGPILDQNVRAWVNGGEMDSSLLGMSYLRRYSGIEITPKSLTLTR